MQTPKLRIAALAIYSCTIFAQNQVQSTLSITVIDPTRAHVPGAHLAVTDETTGARLEATTDASGQATFHLNEGHYDLKVWAKAFKSYEEKPIEVKTETHRDVTLHIADTGGPPLVQGTPEFPLETLLEPQMLASEIPLIPIQQFLPTAKPLRHRPHWL